MRRALSVCVLAFFAALAGTLSAQAAPSMSRGEQKLPIRYQECMNRAMQAFQRNGWVNIGQGGAFVQAYRGSEGAYITCNEVGSITVVNVFVASDNPDSNVPGAARQQLQAGMDGNFAGGGGGGPAPVVSGSQQQWRIWCCGNAYTGIMSITTQQQGNVVNFTGTLSSDYGGGGSVAGWWNTATGAVSFRREIGSPNNVQNHIGTIVNQGGKILMINGTWDGAYSGSAPPDWHAELLSTQ